MINYERWIDSLPKTSNNFDQKQKNHLDPDIWINTIPKAIPKKKIFSSIGKYSFTAILFVCGLIMVSAVKNETRNLQKEINNLYAFVKVLNSDLDQAILDNEVLTSPENISLLAKEYLDDDFIHYKRSQIKNLEKETYNEKNIEKTNSKLSKDIKVKISAKIKKKREEIKKLRTLYSEPKAVPKEIKKQIVKTIEEKKSELKNAYNSPNDIFTSSKAQKWAVVQLVKAFLGIPIVPGK